MESEWVDDPIVGEDDWKDDEEAPLISARGLLKGTLEALPVAGALAGGAIGTFGAPGPGTIAGAGLGAGAGKALQNLGEKYLLDEEKTREDIYAGPAKAVLEGATYEMGGQALGKAAELASPYISEGAEQLGHGIKKVAGKFAKNSTGATGAQSAKFADDAGEQLLDLGMVRFGDNAENIANRTAAEMRKANGAIDSSLQALDKGGAQASADNVVATLETKIAELQKDPSQAGLVKKLKGIVEDIIQTGESNIPLSQGEITKRGFNKAAGNWMDPEAGQAGKQAYLAYMDEVERAATAADPALASKFKDGKETYGLLRPIQEAAERRVATLNQSPLGGLLDVTAAGGTGATVGGIPGMIAGAGAAAGRRVIAPRVSSSIAVTLDKISKSLLKSPQMATLAKESPEAFQGMVQMLGNKLGNIDQMAPMSLPRAADKDQSSMNYEETSGKEAILGRAQGSKYAQVLQQAADRGDDSLNAAHFVLSQRDPDYRKTISRQGP